MDWDISMKAVAVHDARHTGLCNRPSFPWTMLTEATGGMSSHVAGYCELPDTSKLVDAVTSGGADLVIGSRMLGGAEPRAFGMVQRFGNSLACSLMRWLWNATYTDLGPLRVIRRNVLVALDMQERAMNWTVEM
ncbi:MAG: hypothetical protein CMM46_12565 [Rhodospirillaceae bacterium]|nr:hypothetical protein [Rhodospirillaceae bacterium]|tara:strand:- start:18870 stop:19271 length:402 start_codon:yes stop_codon:yes gene_type:complete